MKFGFSAAALMASAMLFSVGTVGAQTVNGVNDVGDGYLTATNSAAGIDTNTRFGFGTSSKSELIRARATATHLYIFIEGSLHSGNRVNVLVDSDASAATGVSAAFPDGTFGESNGMERFSDVANGGWDTLISVGCAGGDPTNQLFVTAVGYTAAAAIEVEDYLGTPGTGNLVGNATDTAGVFRTITNTNTTPVQVGLVPGDAANNGVEIGIPVGYLSAGFVPATSFRLAVINTNGSSNFHSNSTIPENANTNNLGGGTGIADLAALTAPTFSKAASVADWTLIAD